MMKNKLDQDQVAMLIADWLDGEWSTCEGLDTYEKCPLNKRMDNNITICHTIELMSEKLNEIEK